MSVSDSIRERLSVCETETTQRAATLLDDTARPLTASEYLQSVLDAEGTVALSLGPTGGRQRYYIYSADGETVQVERNHTVPRTFDPEDSYIVSLVETYDPEFVVPENFEGLSHP